MIRLTPRQIQDKINFIKDYVQARNAASASTVDANANVTEKNIATLQSELYKDFNIQINRALIKERLTNLFDADIAEQYEKDLESHLIYCHDESSLSPYCVSISMYPFLLNGMEGLGGESQAPKHLESFCGSFGNLAFAISAQFAGALATPEFLMFFDYFARKDYGDNYLENPETCKWIEQKFQHVIYVIAQPATARGYQSIFWNVSLFDKYFFKHLFKDFSFPDGTKPVWASVERLQRMFMQWLREERKRALLTFPVVTLSALTDGATWKDQSCLEWAADEYAQGSEFFIYTSQTVDSLSSCCRLRNPLKENTFSYSMGAGGVMTGSKNVITINMNRLVQQGHNLADVIDRVHKYQVCFEDLFQWFFKANLLTVYQAGFIDLKKQFLTLGINGIVEAAESLGYEITNNDAYKSWLVDTLRVFKEKNKEAGAKYHLMFNTEVVPAENLGIKNAKWDKKSGLKVQRDCYNSYFYRVEDASLSLFDKMELHGGEILDNLDGGSALHFNNDEKLTPAQYRKVFESLAVTGSNYFCENCRRTICKTCGYIHPFTSDHCVKCGSTDIEYAVRIIGYLKRISNFSEARQAEAGKRYYHRGTL